MTPEPESPPINRASHIECESGCRESHALHVAATTSVSALAGAIANLIRTHGRCELQAVGAAAVNQAVKSTAIARGYLAPAGHEISVKPAFVDIVIDEQERTAIRLLIRAD